MTNTEAQAVLGTMLMRYDLTDAELEAIGMAGEALEDEWISVEEMLPPIVDKEDRTSGEMLIVGRIGNMDVAHYDYRHKEWAEVGQHFRNITHWRYLPKPPEVESC